MKKIPREEYASSSNLRPSPIPIHSIPIVAKGPLIRNHKIISSFDLRPTGKARTWFHPGREGDMKLKWNESRRVGTEYLNKI